MTNLQVPGKVSQSPSLQKATVRGKERNLSRAARGSKVQKQTIAFFTLVVATLENIRCRAFFLKEFFFCRNLDYATG